MPTFKGDQEAIAADLRAKGLIGGEGAPVRLPAAGGASAKKKRGRPEYEFQKTVIEYARLKGWLVAHFRAVPVRDRAGNVYHQTPVDADGAGFPDLILLRRERVVVAELKAGPNKPGPEQVRWLEAFHAAAFVEVFVWRPKDWPTIERELS